MTKSLQKQKQQPKKKIRLIYVILLIGTGIIGVMENVKYFTDSSKRSASAASQSRSQHRPSILDREGREQLKPTHVGLNCPTYGKRMKGTDSHINGNQLIPIDRDTYVFVETNNGALQLKATPHKGNAPQIYCDGIVASHTREKNTRENNVLLGCRKYGFGTVEQGENHLPISHTFRSPTHMYIVFNNEYNIHTAQKGAEIAKVQFGTLVRDTYGNTRLTDLSFDCSLRKN